MINNLHAQGLNKVFPNPNDHEIVTNGFDIGIWMLDSKGNIAHWLDQKYKNKQLREPINVILCVQTQSPIEANIILDKSMRQAGFRPRNGHSNGYRVLINNDVYDQASFKIEKKSTEKEGEKNKEFTYSNASFLKLNDHGRIFGPVFQNNQYCYTGAFSIEVPQARHHVFVSFLEARKNLEENLIQKAGARETGYAFLHNNIPEDDSNLTTGDHDGNAVILELLDN